MLIIKIIYRAFSIRIKYFCLAITYALLVYSCECKNEDCPALSENAKSYLAISSIDSIKFINSLEDTLIFRTNSTTYSNSYQTKCRRAEVSCLCEPCVLKGKVKMICDSSINGENIYSLEIEEKKYPSEDSSPNISFELNINIFDHTSIIDLENPNRFFKQGDSLISSLQIGSKTYQNVYALAIDTLNIENSNINIWKIYYSQSKGIVGFFNRETHSFFYRE